MAVYPRMDSGHAFDHEAFQDAFDKKMGMLQQRADADTLNAKTNAALAVNTERESAWRFGAGGLSERELMGRDRQYEWQYGPGGVENKKIAAQMPYWASQAELNRAQATGASAETELRKFGLDVAKERLPLENALLNLEAENKRFKNKQINDLFKNPDYRVQALLQNTALSGLTGVPLEQLMENNESRTAIAQPAARTAPVTREFIKVPPSQRPDTFSLADQFGPVKTSFLPFRLAGSLYETPFKLYDYYRDIMR